MYEKTSEKADECLQEVYVEAVSLTNKSPTVEK